MTGSISDLIGLNSLLNERIANESLAVEQVNPDDYPILANSVKLLDVDIRNAYADAIAQKEAQELVDDHDFLDRAKEYVELNEQVETSASLLFNLSSFLSSFQRDLSAVSGHISELQGRSKTIEGRLESRKAIERSLHPLLASIVITPDLITVIMDTEVALDWVPAVQELDAKLGVIRSGPRVESRKVLDDVAEALRIKASQKILQYLLAALKPYSFSVDAPINLLQSSVLLPSKPFFDFLRRHSARQAHEFQKAYTSTIRWFYETGFRRYVRALETVRLRSAEKHEEIGMVTSTSETPSSLLSRRTNGQDVTSSPNNYSRVDGGNVITATAASTKEKPPIEALFYSISLVMMDNAETEYEFLTTFFGQHSDLPSLPTISRAASPITRSFSSSSLVIPSRSNSLALVSGSISPPSGKRRDSMIDVNRFEREIADDASSDENSADRATMIREAKADKLRKTVIDLLWKSIMEPAQEYSKNFVVGLFDPLRCSPTSALTMLRLNDDIISFLVADEYCPPMQGYLMSIRLSLWPLFQKVMGIQVDSLRRINGTSAKFTKTAVKDSAIQIITLRYVALFNAIITLSSEQEEDDIVFANLIRVRNELSALIRHQASKMPDPAKGKAFLSTHYEELLEGLSIGKSSHVRRQGEIAHFRELARSDSIRL